MSRLNLQKNMIIDGAKLLNLLGTGTSGEVWSALTNEGNLIALKIYSTEEKLFEKAKHEYDMASCFDNCNILKPIRLSAASDHPIIHMPYCEGRSVDGVAAHFSEKMIWKLIDNISNALMDIHDKGYAHLDIKPSNILWNGTIFILSDFGACIQTSDGHSKHTAFDESSYCFDAPELAKNKSAACDIWSLGATVFYLYMGCHVFNGLGGRAQHKGSPVPYIRKSLPTLSKLVQSCLDLNPDNRPCAKEINKVANKEQTRIDGCSYNREIKQLVPVKEKTGTSEFWPDEMIEP